MVKNELKNKRANIYRDLNDRSRESKSFEGVATIVDEVFSDDDRSYCEVRFDGERETFNRFVMHEDVYED